MVTEAAFRRTKTSAVVVEYLQKEIFAGNLRYGDRVDVERIGATIGVSPTPVREALVLLERDGLIATRVHRVAFVQHFDARTLRADFHVLGLLSGVSAARVAKDRDPEVLAQLQDLLRTLANSEATGVQLLDLAEEIVLVQHRAGSTPRLLAELKGVGGFLAWAVRQSDRRTREEIVEAQRLVIDAIAAGDPSEASRARLQDTRAAGEDVIRELTRRGVLREDGTNAAG
ncbi:MULTISPECIES: GntR family transcriptional regulator [Parafrankia]|uniref:GntR family transcriptional regulator n=1 Tax=Parafrankia TaxID=2994362 RepID=UPI0013F4D955|nr:MULTISPECIES: GntR family transcriptional regulator [Parafrankia]MBE3204039.1 GntR family transcriptional regulator [Parafrankia sp. CH37]